MEDDHVDRPGVEAQQCVKLTGTNSSIGLIVLILNAHRKQAVQAAQKEQACGNRQPAIGSIRLPTAQPDRQNPASHHAFRRPGGHGGAAAPDPIPNSAVKRSSADGTSSQDAGE